MSTLDKPKFEWTDELVKEFANFYKSKQGVDYTTWGKCIMDSFKQSKVPPLTDTKGSRIEINRVWIDQDLTNDYKDGWYAYQFSINTSIHPAKFPEIKNILERYLNGEMDNPAPPVLNNDTEDTVMGKKNYKIMGKVPKEGGSWVGDTLVLKDSDIICPPMSVIINGVKYIPPKTERIRGWI